MSHQPTLLPNTRSSLLIALLIGFVSLFALGCGDSQENFVFTGTAQTQGNTGNAVFQFVQAQQAGVVPGTTDSLLFEFFDDNENRIFDATADFNPLVTIAGVPKSATSVLVTAYDLGGIPLVTLTGTLSIVPDGSTDVSLSAPTPVTFDSISVSPAQINLSLASGGQNSAQLAIVGAFSNGDLITFAPSTFNVNAEFASSNESVANVSTTGQVTAVGDGDATINVTYTVNEQDRIDTVEVNISGGELFITSLRALPANSFTFPSGTSFKPIFLLELSDGTQDLLFDVTQDSLQGRLYDISLSSINPSIAEVTTSNVITFGNTTGSTTVLVDAGSQVNTTLTLTTIPLGNIESNVVLPHTLNLTVNQTAAYQTVFDYGTGTQDVTLYLPMVRSSGDGGEVDLNIQTAEGTDDVVQAFLNPSFTARTPGTVELSAGSGFVFGAIRFGSLDLPDSVAFPVTGDTTLVIITSD